jgi:hypothetical protein
VSPRCTGRADRSVLGPARIERRRGLVEHEDTGDAVSTAPIAALRFTDEAFERSASALRYRAGQDVLGRGDA